MQRFHLAQDHINTLHTKALLVCSDSSRSVLQFPGKEQVGFSVSLKSYQLGILQGMLVILDQAHLRISPRGGMPHYVHHPLQVANKVKANHNTTTHCNMVMIPYQGPVLFRFSGNLASSVDIQCLKYKCMLIQC
jgi:hypothetical protein